MSKLIIANWKLHPLSEKEAMRIAKASDFRNVVIVPPFPFLSQVKNALKKASLGAQDVFYEESGAYTGEVSAHMLKNLGAKYVIIGHSERRRFLNETDEMVAKKVKAAFQAKLNVILCIGEPMSVRRKGSVAVLKFIEEQLSVDLKLIKSFKFSAEGGFASPASPSEAGRAGGKIKNLFIVYEPIWAIGTGKNADPKDVAEIAIFIKKLLTTHGSTVLSSPPKGYSLQIRVLYGGSVNSKNISGFLSKSEIDGALVGEASLRPSEIRAMAKIVNGRNNVKIKNQKSK